jgi:hypothetical protein
MKTAIFVIVFFAPVLAYGASIEQKYQRKVVKAAQSCVKKRESSPIVCWIKATPRKCQPLAYGLMDTTFEWAVCVRSCATAGVWESQFGDCKREI